MLPVRAPGMTANPVRESISDLIFVAGSAQTTVSRGVPMSVANGADCEREDTTADGSVDPSSASTIGFQMRSLAPPKNGLSALVDFLGAKVESCSTLGRLTSSREAVVAFDWVSGAPDFILDHDAKGDADLVVGSWRLEC